MSLALINDGNSFKNYFSPYSHVFNGIHNGCDYDEARTLLEGRLNSVDDFGLILVYSFLCLSMESYESNDDFISMINTIKKIGRGDLIKKAADKVHRIDRAVSNFNQLYPNTPINI